MCFRYLSSWVPRRYHRHFFLFLISLTLVLVYHLQEMLFRPRLESMVIYKVEELGVRNPNVTCEFPIPHPFDSSILSHIKVATPVSCGSWYKHLLKIDDDGYLTWNVTALLESGFSSDGGSLQCTFQEIWRQENNDFEVYYEKKTPFYGNKTKFKSDFAYVECKTWFGFQVYQGYLAKIEKIQGIRKYKEGELDVLVIGLDSVSRLNFMRQLPKAYRLITKELDATVMLGFNKVGHNTFPNVVPMLTGRPLIIDPQYRFKDWPFIWKDFANAGAVTLYAEDQPHINMFDYNAEGIDEQPTHHYMHTYWLAADASLLRKRSARLCLGSRPKHSIYFSYIKSFLQKYSKEPKFLFSLLNGPTHNHVNTAGVIDDELTEFFNSSYHEGLFNRSVVVILGDHGNRLDTIRSTQLGKIEDAMPMVSIILPKWVNPSWKKTLFLNSNRLTSTYDLYATFVDILHTLGGKPGKPGKTDKRLWDHFIQPPRGQSLFTEISVSRDCEEAGIPDMHCVCKQGENKLQFDDVLVIKSVNIVINYINKLLEDFPLCATLNLDRITWAVKKHKKQTVHVTFITKPSNALFEATLLVGKDLKIIDLQRINPYGTQAKCLSKEILSNNTLYKSTCYCKGIFTI